MKMHVRRELKTERKKKTNTVGTKALNTEGVLSNDFETNNTICTIMSYRHLRSKGRAVRAEHCIFVLGILKARTQQSPWI